jgi:hypothetical protein
MLASRDEITGKWTLEGVEDDKTTYKRICNMLVERKNFKFARYGDGEISCMMGKEGHNTDKHEYFPSLGKALNNAVKEAKTAGYMVGIQPLSVQMWPDLVDSMFDFPVFNADVLHSASIDGEIGEFCKALNERHLIVVGPTHLWVISDGVHIVTPDLNCWNHYESICDNIEFYLEGYVDAVVLLSCSMMAEVIIDRFKDYHHTFIDTGSVFDPYCGVNSRKYHYKLEL